MDGPIVRAVNTDLDCPFSQKDDAKALGARWNPKRKKWYVPSGKDLRPFRRWLPDGWMHKDGTSPLDGLSDNNALRDAKAGGLGGAWADVGGTPETESFIDRLRRDRPELTIGSRPASSRKPVPAEDDYTPGPDDDGEPPWRDDDDGIDTFGNIEDVFIEAPLGSTRSSRAADAVPKRLDAGPSRLFRQHEQ